MRRSIFLAPAFLFVAWLIAPPPERAGAVEAGAGDTVAPAPARTFSQGAQVSGACAIPETDDPDTWQCETEGPGCQPGNATRWMTASAEYQALAAQTFHFAGLQALSLGQTHERGTWAIAVDLDETVISNALYTLERDRCGRGYSRASWADWSASEQATPLPGAKDFLDLVYNAGGLIVGVTNRRESEAAATTAVLKRHDLPVDIVLYRGDADNATGEKEARWARVPALLADMGFPDTRIVMWMGDQITDFPDLDQGIRAEDGDIKGPFGTRYIVLPNPMYGEWEHR